MGASGNIYLFNYNLGAGKTTLLNFLAERNVSRNL
jgi:G3E family GTPase